MTRTSWLGAALVLLTLGRAAPAAEESPLAPVPAAAPFVIHLRGVEQATDRLWALAQNALPDETARRARTRLGEVLKQKFQGRTLKGLAPAGPIFLVFPEMPGPGEKPRAAFVLRVRNYAEFRDAVLKEDERKALKADPAGYERTTIDGDETYFVNRKGYAVLATDRDVAARFTRKGPGLDTRLDREDARKFLAADFSVYVNMTAVNRGYAAQIRKGREFLDGVLGRMTLAGGADKAGSGAAREMTELLFQAVQDSEVFLCCAEFRPEGLLVHARLGIGAGTRTSALMKGFTLAPFGELARLPAGELEYSALQVEPALLKLFPAWLYGISAGAGGEPNPVIQGAIRELTEAKPRARFQSVSTPGPNLQLWVYEDPARVVKARLQVLRALKAGDTFEGVLLKERPKVGADARTYRGFRLHAARLTWDVEKMLEATADKEVPADFRKRMTASMRKLLGEGKRTWFGTDGKVFVQVAARDWEAARHQLDCYLDGQGTVGREQAFQDARNHLPARTTVLHLLDATRYAATLGEFLQSVEAALPDKAPGGPGAPDIPKGKTAYLGMAITLQPGGGSLDVWVPAPAVRPIHAAFERLFMALDTDSAP